MGKFLINGDAATPQPHNIAHPVLPELGRFQGGSVRSIGYEEIEAQWEVMTEAQMRKLYTLFYATWQGQNCCWLQYDGERGEPVSERFWMSEPLASSRVGAYYMGVSCNFRALTPLRPCKSWDSFDRADGAIGDAESGETWTGSGTWVVSGNKANCSSDTNEQIITIDPGLTNFSIEADVYGYWGSSTCRNAGLVFGWTAGDWYEVIPLDCDAIQINHYHDSAHELLIESDDAGDYLDVGPYHLKVRVRNNEVDVWWRWAHNLSCEISTPASTRCGLVLHKSGSPSDAAYWDNFRVTR